MAERVEYPNLQSRLLLKPWFDRQFIIPESPPKFLTRFLQWYENRVLNVEVGGIEIDRPIFLVSLPRAGSSMLQNIMCVHPDVAYISHSMHMFPQNFCASEHLRRRFKLNARGQRYLGDSVEVDAESPCDPIVFWSDWLDIKFDDVQYRELHLEDYPAEHITRVKNTIKRILWCFGGTGKRFFTKNPGLLPYLDLLVELFPDAKFIHLIRDPRASANSLLKLYRRDKAQFEKLKAEHPDKVNIASPFIPYPRVPKLKEYLEIYGPDDIHTTAHVWNDAIDFVNTRKNKLSSFYEIRYEDFLADPKNKITELFEFCELSPLSDEHQEFRNIMEKVGVIQHKNQYGAFDTVEAICAENMKLYGYV